LQLIRSVYSSLILFQALSKQLTGTEFISRFSVQSSLSQLSFEFLQSELSQFWALRTEHFIFDYLLWMNDFWYHCLNTLPLFVTDSNLVSGFESTAVHEIRKYKFYDIACSDVLFVVHRYHYKFVGLAGSGIDSATISRSLTSGTTILGCLLHIALL